MLNPYQLLDSVKSEITRIISLGILACLQVGGYESAYADMVSGSWLDKGCGTEALLLLGSLAPRANERARV